MGHERTCFLHMRKNKGADQLLGNYLCSEKKGADELKNLTALLESAEEEEWP